MAQPKVLKLYRKLKAIDAEMERLKAEFSLVKAEFIKFADKDKIISYNGIVLSKFTEVNGRTTVDTTMLQVKYPDIYNEVVKKGEKSERFSLK